MKTVKYHTGLRYEPNMDVKTIAIDLIYVIDNDQDHTFDLNLIRRMIRTTANGYETDALFTNELQKRLIIEYSVGIKDVGNTSLLRFSLTIPKKDLVSDYDMDEAINFFKNAIFNPYAEDGHFNEERFELEKKGLRTNYINSKNSVYANAERIFRKYADPEEKLGKSFDYNLNLIDTSTPTSVYEYYKKIVLDNNFLLYIGGCVEEDVANYIYEKHFKQEKKEFEVNLDYYDFFKPTEEAYHEEKFEFNQSALYMEYRAEDLKEEDLRYFSMISNILSTSENDLIFDALRIKNNLVYVCYTERYNYHGLFYVEAYLSKENKDKAIEVVKEVFESLKDKEMLTECIKRLKKGISLNLIRELDQKYQALERLISKDLYLKSLQDIYDQYEDITVEDLISFLDRVKLNNIVFIEGDKDGEN